MKISVNSTNFNARIQFNNAKPNVLSKPSTDVAYVNVVKKRPKKFSLKRITNLISLVGVLIKKIKTTVSSVKLPS